jgi:hypothetical protein
MQRLQHPYESEIHNRSCSSLCCQINLDVNSKSQKSRRHLKQCDSVFTVNSFKAGTKTEIATCYGYAFPGVERLWQTMLANQLADHVHELYGPLGEKSVNLLVRELTSKPGHHQVS